MSEQPQPEWTGLSLSRLIKEKGYKGAADAHNAALAAAEQAAYQRGLKDHEIWMSDQLTDDWKAKATLREKYELVIDEEISKNNDLRQQLAAEREEKEESIADAKGLWEDCLQLREQLDALAKVKPYPLPDGPTNRGRLRDAEK